MQVYVDGSAGALVALQHAPARPRMR